MTTIVYHFRYSTALVGGQVVDYLKAINLSRETEKR